MLKLNKENNLRNISLKDYLNTSYVEVKLNVSMFFYPNIGHLNTSYVEVKLAFTPSLILSIKDLNTSYVEVKHILSNNLTTISSI